MGGHYGESAVRDGAQGSLRTRERRRRKAQDDDELLDALNTSELVAARETARGVTREVIQEFVRQLREAQRDSDRRQAGLVLMRIGWGEAFLGSRSSKASRGEQMPGMITVNIIDGDGRVEQQVAIDVGAEEKPEVAKLIEAGGE